MTSNDGTIATRTVRGTISAVEDNLKEARGILSKLGCSGPVQAEIEKAITKIVAAQAGVDGIKVSVNELRVAMGGR